MAFYSQNNLNTNKPHIIQRSLALLVLVAFLLPVLINFAHATDNHHHFDTCTEFDTHVHESKLDCYQDDLQMVDVGFYAFAKAYSFPSLIFTQTKFFLPTSSYTQIAIHISDRGPPSIC